jgi:hypothetical protein
MHYSCKKPNKKIEIYQHLPGYAFMSMMAHRLVPFSTTTSVPNRAMPNSFVRICAIWENLSNSGLFMHVGTSSGSRMLRAEVESALETSWLSKCMVTCSEKKGKIFPMSVLIVEYFIIYNNILFSTYRILFKLRGL